LQRYILLQEDISGCSLEGRRVNMKQREIKRGKCERKNAERSKIEGRKVNWSDVLRMRGIKDK
jgi:hypothetical protein